MTDSSARSATLSRFEALVTTEWKLARELYPGKSEVKHLRHSVLPSQSRAFEMVVRLRQTERMGHLFTLIEQKQRAGSVAQVLDAGCGHGDQALVMALLGARVIAIDLRTDRIELARQRLAWWEQQTGQRLDIEFINRDIFQVIKDYTFDGIWLQEAIQHIHPAEDFLVLARSQMRPGGVLVISDSNRLNPLSFFKLLPHYWKHSRTLKWFVHTQFADPVTGREVAMASERVFSKWALKRMLRSAGFKSVMVEANGVLPLRRFALLVEGFPGEAGAKVIAGLAAIDQIAKKLPVSGWVGTTLTATASV